MWERTSAYLKRQLDLPKNATLRDHQPALALDYQRIAEGVSAHRLGEREELSWEEARLIVQEVAKPPTLSKTLVKNHALSVCAECPLARNKRVIHTSGSSLAVLVWLWHTTNIPTLLPS